MHANNQLRDIPFWFCVAVPALVVLFSLYGFCWSEEFLKFLLRRDEHPLGAGIAEHGTVLILFPGIVAGVAVLRHYRQALPFWFVGMLTGWILACVYLAGEEASWGQHYFRWGTPDAFQRLNDQQETNFHNMSSWFHQKPRALVQLWMIFAGLIVPILHHFKPNALYAKHAWAKWFWPTGFAIPTVLALLFAFVVYIVGKKTSSAELMRLGSNELREFYVAFFLSGYLISLWLRLRHARDNEARAHPTKTGRTSSPQRNIASPESAVPNAPLPVCTGIAMTPAFTAASAATPAGEEGLRPGRGDAGSQ